VKASIALAPALRDAAQLVARVADGHSLNDEFARAEAGAGPSRAAVLDLVQGTLRRYGRVQAIVEALSQRPPDVPVQALLWCSLYAFDSGRYAQYTVVDQAVKASALLERWSAKGYVNALLRRFLRERALIEERLAGNEEARYQHPGWWLEIVRDAYPQAWEATLAEGNRPPPMCLRVNRRRTSVEGYLARLADAGIASRRLFGEALLLEQPLPVQRLPGFADGDVSVQDAGAQRAVRILDLADGQRVLDACAAPGGKAAHALESANIELTAIDIDAARVERLGRNLRRLGLQARVEVADAAAYSASKPFDRILADVPCSGSGVARRHPDIKWLRRPSDVERYAAQQAGLLDALWRLLRPGGKLLYATCSVFPQENNAVTAAFVARSPGARRLAPADGLAEQWLPSAEHDGFYYALIEKPA
jgi:16S rRNA (cytosine967-C5)-methyltransferase